MLIGLGIIHYVPFLTFPKRSKYKRNGSYVQPCLHSSRLSDSYETIKIAKKGSEMIDTTLPTVIIGFVALLLTILWTERRHDKRADRQDERLGAIEIDVAVIKTELVRVNERADKQDERMDRQDGRFDEMQRGINGLGSKIDRAQGNLDVLVFGERGVPPPVLRERSELESPVEEAVGDD